ncbi:hypothetical protein DPMN_119089 [Dreissena polymorpha]|uniref:Uncharacterized protein n=1 Tax=Dreissena polymorpha TaxID=45954 RepID=A0A9D4JMD7_DREPO|nr:hypothetical protein DPMN_119089 [Dreissena polymorpha]
MTIRKNVTPPWRTYIIGTNHLTKFHYDPTVNVASRILTRKNAPPLGSHVLQANVTIFCSQSLTIAIHSHIRKKSPPLGSHVFQANVTIFKLIQDIIETNLLTKFHEDWTINVASRENFPPPGGHCHDDWAKIVTSRVFTGFLYSHIGNTAPPPGGHVFQRT